MYETSKIFIVMSKITAFDEYTKYKHDKHAAK